MMRVKIKDSKREFFFSKIKQNLDLSWKEMGLIFSIPKSTFEKYRSGKLLIPEDIFSRLLEKLPIPDKKITLNHIEKFPDNFGQIMGGKSAYEINKAKFKIGRALGAKRSKIKQEVKFNFEVYPKICELVGTYIGDGMFNVYKNKLYQVEFSGDKRFDLKYYQKVIIPIIKEIIPEVNPHFYYSKYRENSIRVVFYSKKLFLFLKDYFEFNPGKKTYTISIPDKIFNAGEDCVRATIRGIFDTDGCVYLDKRKSYANPYPRICLQIKSNSLYHQLITYLGKYFKLHHRFQSNRQIYIIEIYGINQVREWMSLIGFSNKRHLDKIASVAQR